MPFRLSKITKYLSSSVVITSQYPHKVNGKIFSLIPTVKTNIDLVFGQIRNQIATHAQKSDIGPLRV